MVRKNKKAKPKEKNGLFSEIPSNIKEIPNRGKQIKVKIWKNNLLNFSSKKAETKKQTKKIIRDK